MAGPPGQERSRGLLVVLSGPSGVGKDTVVAAAMGSPRPSAARLRLSVSVTTRPPRPEECEGRDYFFRSPEEFDQMVRAGELLEWATYLDHRYGTPGPWVDSQLGAGYDVVLEIEVKGAMQVRERRPEAVLVYMLPPSWEELCRRLARRRSESEELQRRRLQVAQEELGYLGRYDYVVVNDVVASAADVFLSILEAEHARVSRADLQALLGGRRV